MNTYRIEAAAPIGAPARRAYQLIADYRHGHPTIVPPRAFSNLQVLEGGVGAGTRIRFDMKVMGRVIEARARVTEPEPGRVLQETDEATGAVTSFVVEPDPGGATCRVTIRTDMPEPRHLLAAIEKWYVRKFLHELFVEELGILDQRVRAST